MRHGMTDEQLIEEIQKNLLQPEDTFLFEATESSTSAFQQRKSFI